MRGCCLALALAVACVGVAKGQTYPSKPVTLIVPYVAGGGTDIVAGSRRRRCGRSSARASSSIIAAAEAA